MVSGGYIYNCNNQNRGIRSKHYACENRRCPARLNTQGWDTVTKENDNHTCEPPKSLIEKLLKWYILQMIPVSKDMKATHLAVKATRYLSEENLKVVPDRDQLVKFICDKRREMRPLGKSASTIEDLVLKPEQKKDHDDELFLLHDDGPEKEERIICYATKKNLEQLRANVTWLCDGTFASCPKIL